MKSYLSMKMVTLVGLAALTLPVRDAKAQVPQNASFEQPDVSNLSDPYSGFVYSPTGGVWTFLNGAGIAHNGSGFTGSLPALGLFPGIDAPDGVQVAFLQGRGSIISQDIAGFNAGTNYSYTFSAVERTNFSVDPRTQDFNVFLDNTLIGTFQPTGNTYADYTTNIFQTTAGTHTLKFVGLDTFGGDETSLIDNIRLNGAVPEPGTYALLGSLILTTATCLRRRRTR